MDSGSTTAVFLASLSPPPHPPTTTFLQFLSLFGGVASRSAARWLWINPPSLSNTQDNVLRLPWKCNKGQRDMPEPSHNNTCLPVKRLRNTKARVRGYTGCRDLILAQVKFVSFFTKLLKYKPELNRIEFGLWLPTHPTGRT